MMPVLYDAGKDEVLSKVHPFHDCGFLSEGSIFQNPAQVDVSVIVPCYNAARFLPGCIESLASQKAACSYEVLLVDDGSTDGSFELIEEAAKMHEGFVCVHQQNQGAAAARNTGMRMARGEYLLFVDADDVVSPSYVQALYDCVRAEGADLGVCAWYAFTGEDRRYKTVRYESGTGTEQLNGTPWGKLFHRRLFEHLLWPSGYWYEDTVLAFLVYPRVRRVACTDKCEYGYRSSAQNATHSGRKSPKALDSLYITHLALKGMEKMGLEGWLNSTFGRKRLMDQFYLNQCRIQRLPRDCQRELFRLQSAYLRHMPPAKEKQRLGSLYALALKKGNAPLGLLCARLEKVHKALGLLSLRASSLWKRKEQNA